MKRERLMIQAHRIFGCEEIPNSIEAMQKAAMSDIDSIETDVWLSKDDQVYIMQGDTHYGKCKVRPLNSPYTEFHSRTIGELSSEELNNLTTDHLEGSPIPSLNDLLIAFKGTNKLLNLEIREPNPSIVGLIIDKFIENDMISQLFLSSFHHYHRKAAAVYCEKKGINSMPFGFLNYSVFSVKPESILSLSQPGDFITLSYRAMMNYESAYRQAYECARQYGVNINVWFDVGDCIDHEGFDSYLHLYNIKIHTIITNYPTQALKHVLNL